MRWMLYTLTLLAASCSMEPQLSPRQRDMPTADTVDDAADMAPSATTGCEAKSNESRCLRDASCSWTGSRCVDGRDEGFAGHIGGIYEGLLTVESRDERAWLTLQQVDLRVIGALSVGGRVIRLEGTLRQDGRLVLGLDPELGYDDRHLAVGRVDGDRIELSASEALMASDWPGFEGGVFSPHEGFKPVMPTVPPDPNEDPTYAGTYLGGAQAYGELGELPAVNYICGIALDDDAALGGFSCSATDSPPSSRRLEPWSAVVPGSYRVDPDSERVGFLVEAGELDVAVIAQIVMTDQGVGRIDMLMLRAGLPLPPRLPALSAVAYEDIVGTAALAP